MIKYARYSVVLFMLFMGFSAVSAKLDGKVLSIDKSPVEGAIISVVLEGRDFSAITAEDGSFSLELPSGRGYIRVVAAGFYRQEYPINQKLNLEEIVLVPLVSPHYSGAAYFPNYNLSRDDKSTSTQSVEKKDFSKHFSIDQAIQDKVPGLYIHRKSGMPGEGAYLNLRGIHSVVADNTPLIVINGIPLLGNQELSATVRAYSRNTLFGYSTDDIRSITLLKGADASVYGSLGSNGVLLIETEQATSDNLETRISFSGQYGLSWPGRSLPVLNVSQYKNYLREIGMTRYDMITALYTDYPFLQNEENYYSYLFNNTTDWRGLVQNRAFITDNTFRVEGGDEIAKYNISFGYTSEGGVLGQTASDRYHTLINSNIMVSRNVDIFTNVGLAYISSSLQEQGMNAPTNAVLSSYFAMPMLSPFMKEPNGNVLDRYATYNGWNVNNNPTYPYDNVSNPLAIVNTINASDNIYDANIRLGLNYRANSYLSFTGLLNIYYNYTEESIFIPGVTDKAIIPQYYNAGLNTVRKGIVENLTNYYGLSSTYRRTFRDIHQLRAEAGLRYVGRKLEYDLAAGYNTANDYYETLGAVTDDRDIQGDNQEWKWLNYHLHTDYIYHNLLKTSVNVALDGSSVSGTDAARFGLFPSLGLTFMAANTGLLPSFVDLFNIAAEVGRTGNSRFSSNYAKNYYQNSNFFNLGTITRSNVPNTALEWEKKDQLDLGLDLGLLDNKLGLQFNYFLSRSFDLLIAREISSVYGSTQYYDNVGEIAGRGYELGLRLNPIVTKQVDWVIGAGIAHAGSKIKALGNNPELSIGFKEFNGDDALILMKEGEAPYQFYGYQTQGIYVSTEEAREAGLRNIYGEPYKAGDVRFVDQNGDNQINARDKVLLGTAAPDFFGSFYTSLRYRRITLSAEFGYSVGNTAYNAVRRNLESMDYFYNQSQAVLNRWQIEGQPATLPRAAYGDPSGNNLFSDRWLEDASYLKLRNLSLSYRFNNLLGVLRSGSIFVAAENLYTWTNYLGSDPEFSYSYSDYMQGFDYAKVSLPLSVKLGFNLNF